MYNHCCLAPRRNTQGCPQPLPSSHSPLCLTLRTWERYWALLSMRFCTRRCRELRTAHRRAETSIKTEMNLGSVGHLAQSGKYFNYIYENFSPDRCWSPFVADTSESNSMENAGVTRKLRLAMLCTGRWMRHTQNRTALKVGIKRPLYLKICREAKIALLSLKTISQKGPSTLLIFKSQH